MYTFEYETVVEYNVPKITVNATPVEGATVVSGAGTHDLKVGDNEIKITGRAKDTIVLLGGENIEPAVIESELNTSPYIETSIVLGQDQKYLGALIVPSKESVIAYAKENNLDTSDYEELLKTKEIIDLLETEIKTKDSTANGFRVCEKIFKFALLPNSFTVGEELSAKQEMMRHKIVAKYEDIIKTLFEN